MRYTLEVHFDRKKYADKTIPYYNVELAKSRSENLGEK
jgi:hypothetical protein